MVFGGRYIFLSTFFAGVFLILLAQPLRAEPSFETDVLPILRANCFRCHGEKTHKAELSLTNQARLLKGGESGEAVVPGKPQESLLYELLRDGDMPPEKEKPRPTKAQIETIRAWIAAGAKFAGGKIETARVTQHDVIPIMLLRCTVCHGGRRREAKLDLRTRASMLAGGKSGPAMVPGRPQDSLLLKRIHAGEMPPRRKLVEVSIKVMLPNEIKTVSRWIAQGAVEISDPPGLATGKPDPLVSDKDRDFWAFHPPRKPAVPKLKDAAQVRNPIDNFILRRLQAKGLTLSPEADRLTLLRRAHVDLIGLPPTPEEVKAFLADSDPRAYEKLIDRLLASPHYGERWGRHWLDLAGYCDSEGIQHSDPLRPFAYRYRDYVIRSFNNDKPYDRFLLEQIAGDELADYENAKTITQELYDNLVATAFLRMSADGTFANITGFVPDRLKVVDDQMEVLGSAVMGLSLKCARCHSHKFDPIPQRDYYRLTAMFKGALDEHDWLRPRRQSGEPGSKDRYLPFVTDQERRAWQEKTKNLKGKEKEKHPQPLIRALWDRGEPSPTYILRRGNYLTPGRLVQPGVPAALTDGKTPPEIKPPWPGAKKTGRRLALARWLVEDDHPLTARVMVNRLWKRHFETGIVATLDNFGRAGARPTHPELLDYLATEFVRRGWSIKTMHRLVMTSATYRQSSKVTAQAERLDPENRLLWRTPLRRLDAETLRDTLLAVAGRLDLTQFGPPQGVKVRADGLVTSVAGPKGWRRSVYVQQRRTQIPTILENFDLPRMNPNCITRPVSTVAPQALHLLNNAMIHDLAGKFAERVREEAGDDPRQQIQRAWLIALGRQPTSEEREIASVSLEQLTDLWVKLLENGADPKEAARRALHNFCHALMNSAAFLYVD
ncbi:MAG: PSD1 domain-containing protein [Planctomycetes bacterium]|nr:PSD1 domain-containing protein [Planctomycetota bacterium]